MTGRRYGPIVDATGAVISQRRANMVGIFHHDASRLRLGTAPIVATHDEWQVAGRRYLFGGINSKALQN